MNILTTYTLKYLRLNKKRTAVTILGVILSSALICGVFLLGVSFQQVMINHEIFMSGNWHAQFLGVPYAQANYITENSAVQTAMFSEQFGNATYGSHNAARPYVYVTAYDTLSFQNHPIQLISGRFPQNGSELLISPTMIRDSGLDLKLGSTLQVTFGKRNFPNYDELVKDWGGENYVHVQDAETFIPSDSKTYTVVGLVKPLSDETSFPAAFPALTYLDPAQLTAADQVDISILARDPRSIYASAPEMAQSVGLEVITNADNQPDKETIVYNDDLLAWMGASSHNNYARFFPVILATLITLIVCGSAFVIYNAFAISIGERKKQFGMFASVGATSAQIRRTVLVEAGVIGAIGIPLGIVSAIVGVGILLRLTQGIVAQLITDAVQGMPLVVSPLVIGLTVLFSAATILLSAWIPARRASRVSPIDAIRQSGEIEEGKPINLRTSPLIRRVFGFEGELALKSLQRDRKRYRTTVLSLMISIVLFVAFNALTLYTNTTYSMANKAMSFDLQVDLDYHQSHAKNFVDEVSQLPEVQRVTYRRSAYQLYVPARSIITDPAYQALQELNGLQLENLPTPTGDTYQFVLEISAVGPAEFAHYAAQLGLDVQQYSDPTAPLAILIDHPNLRQAGKLYDFDLFTLKPGDTMTTSRMPEWATAPTGGDATASLTWKIGAVTRTLPLGFLGTTLVPELIVSDAVFDGLSDQMLKLGPINPGGMYIQSNDTDAAVTAIRRVYQSTVGGNFTYYSTADINKSQNLQALLINLFFYGFLTLITLIGVTNIINTLDTNIKLRRREIAMLKSVGLTPGGFLRMLRYESLF
ncbi:MAG TPA: FtsX-like permease family protein, partial [Phototrophicaceae bacterium]|nr:FtsX-like permease family protein [Phototrophicaceae bacterium]